MIACVFEVIPSSPDADAAGGVGPCLFLSLERSRLVRLDGRKWQSFSEISQFVQLWSPSDVLACTYISKWASRVLG